MNQQASPTVARQHKTSRMAQNACLLAGFLSLLSPLAGAQQPANSPAEVFQQLNANNWVSREVSLSELGFTGPLVLGAPDTRREIYLPVPPNVPLSNGEIKLNASYMRADGGRTSLVLSLDSYPVSSRPFALEKGDASLVLGVDGSARPGGFVRLGLNWSTALGADWICADGRTPGNVLRVEPDSRFSYRYDASAIRDLVTAWGALPTVPVILVSSKNLGSDAYDSAWRMGAALERTGKRSRIVILPMVGDVVDLEGVSVPPGLRNVPGFAGLAQGGKYKLKDSAEVGALLSLGASGPFRADIVIADKAITTAMGAAFDAMRTQLQAAAPDAVAPYGEWRRRALDLPAGPMVAKEVRLANLFGRPTIVVAADAGAKAAGLFSAYWNKLAISPLMIVQAADEPVSNASAVSLKYLGGKPGSFDVLAHADWNTSFDMGAVAADGRLPATLVLDVAASPSAARTPPVVSIFMNDVLLGAKQMDANGKRERITAPIPPYALAARNLLRVSFVRQLASDRCRETPEAYPVSVLPSSHMLLEKADPGNDFNGMVLRYATGAHVMVPAAYMADSANTLPRVVRLAATTGVSPVNARFTAVNGDAMPATGGPFLALELPLKDQPSKIKLDGGRIVMASSDDKVLFDASGLNGAGVIEVLKIGADTGVMYRNVGTHAPGMDKTMLLAQGDVAVIGTGGLLTEINTADPSGRAVMGGAQKPWMISGSYWWLLPILCVVAMVMLLVFASRTRRRRASEKADL
ncbi:MAG: cellulose biosynthesis cyclic di-GMP-binding regulatory protein BcsB [Pseudomonadota bacterium]